jgi:alanyl-tRNA synthetase
MTPVSSHDVRKAFVDFFRERGHETPGSGPIVPANDPTLMFAAAGMVQFKDLFTGKEKRGYTRATTSQKCIRISGKHNDLENVGVTARHHTFFEMLGNFSFGDYFKRDAITYAWEFLTKTLGIPKEKLVITVFGGEGGLPADDEARAIWKEVAGLSDERIIGMGAKDNFWSAGDTGPCGPCSEIHYFHGDDVDLSIFDQEPGLDGKGWTEIWNLVFMQFERHEDGSLTNLPAPSIDTGAGLERLSAVVQGVRSNYDTDLLRPIVDLAAAISGKSYGGTLSHDDISMRVLADHARTAAFLIAEGIFPDRDGRNYVLRRVMRRAIRHGHRLGIERLFFHECALKVVDVMGEAYPALVERRALIEEITKQEEERFRRTMRRGLEHIEAFDGFVETNGQKTLPGQTAFLLYDTYGFPLDLQEVIGQEQGFAIDHAGFDAAMDEARAKSAGSKVGEKGVDDLYRAIQQELPKTKFVGYDREHAKGVVAAIVSKGARVETLGEGEEGELVLDQTPFYAESGGQVGDEGELRVGDVVFVVKDTQKPVDGLFIHRGRMKSGSIAVGNTADAHVDHALRSATRRNHSATHLLHFALRTVLGPQAMQKGSLVGPDRLRFDYSSPRALTRDELSRIEEIVNAKVLENADITTDVLPMDDAKKRGAIGIFEEKYGDVVRMLTMTQDSIELCGGTHAARTGDLGLFKIVSESGLAAGVRRIEAATGTNALRFVRELEHELGHAAELVKASPMKTAERVEKLLQTQKELQREIDQLKKQLVSGGSGDLTANAKKVGDVNVLGATVELGDANSLRELADQLRDKLAPSVIALGTATKDGRALLVCTVSKELVGKFQAGKLVGEMAAKVGGKGGGRPDFAQAGGNEVAKVGEAVDSIYDLVAAT